MLLTYSQWKKAVSKISRECDKRLIKSLQTRHQRVERHFSTDYSGCQGAKDLSSEPTDLWVCLDIFGDFSKLEEGQNFADLFDVTPLVELANGETLSDVEAIGGLGTFAPNVSAPEKEKVREADAQARLRIKGYRESSSDGTEGERIPSV